MKISPLLIVAVLTLGLAAADADAARRFGGGGNLGKQRAAPTQKEAVKQAPAAPAQAAPAAPAPQPSFMSRFGGLIAGLGIGALLATLFAGPMGGMGTVLLALLAAGLAFFAWRAFAARRASPASGPMEFAAAGSTAGTGPMPSSRPALNIGAAVGAAPAAAAQPEPAPIPGFEAEPFLRVAKTSFIRLQAANDAKDLADIRDFTTPEMFAELSMQIADRGDEPQRTEVVTVNASLVEAVVEGDFAIVSVRFTGLIRETAGANPEPYDELWHVRKSMADRKATWLIAGIQQVA